MDKNIVKKIVNSVFIYLGLVILQLQALPHLKPDEDGYIALAPLFIFSLYGLYVSIKNLIALRNARLEMQSKCGRINNTKVTLDKKMVEEKTKKIFIYIWAIEIIIWVIMECNPKGILAIVLLISMVYIAKQAYESYHLIQFVKKRNEEEQNQFFFFQKIADKKK